VGQAGSDITDDDSGTKDGHITNISFKIIQNVSLLVATSKNDVVFISNKFLNVYICNRFNNQKSLA
jgi:hypothetical protein